MEKLQMLLEEVKAGKGVNESELLKLVTGREVTLDEINNFIKELKEMNVEEAKRVEQCLAEHISGIADVSYSDIKSLSKSEIEHVDTMLAKKISDGYENHLEEQVKKLDYDIIEGMENVKERIKNGKIPYTPRSLERAITYNAKDAEMTKAIEEHFNVTNPAELAETLSFEEVSKMITKAKIPFIEGAIKTVREEDLIREAEDQIKEVGSMIKSEEDQIEITCSVGMMSKTLVDGLNCNIVPVQILNSAIIANIGLEIKKVMIEPEMESIEDLMIVVQLYEEESITTHVIKLEDLIEAGLAIVVDSLTNILEFTSVEFRGLTKMVDYGEIIQLLNN